MAFTPTDQFIHIAPSQEAVWRAIILFGRNVASYKFALGKSLLELARAGKTQATLPDLARPFSHHLCQHLRQADRQGTFGSSRFLNACRQFNEGTVTEADLIATTVRLGFANVIDAFHVVGQGEVAFRFFTDDRRNGGGVTLTDEVLSLASGTELPSLSAEVEARWRLVETAWDLGVTTSILEIAPTLDAEQLEAVIGTTPRIRRAVTSSRDALNGYQKGKCFYCLAPVAPDPTSPLAAEVDHLFPIALGRTLHTHVNLNGVWNLVLACRRCNRGAQGKFDRLVVLPYVERLQRRNDYLIDSHHPLRETLIRQTGATPDRRRAFLQQIDAAAVTAFGITLNARWAAPDEQPPAF
jgi:hypothetical protein